MLSSLVYLALCSLPALLKAAPIDAADVIASDTCTYTSPINGDCNFDWNADLALNSSNMRDPIYQKSFYASTYKAVTADNPSTPMRGGGNARRRVRRDDAGNNGSIVSATALFKQLNSYFQKAYATITVSANKAYFGNMDQLINGYQNSGPSPAEGLTWCNPATDPYTWCDSTTNQPTQDSPMPGMDDTNNADSPGSVCTPAADGTPCPSATFFSITAINGSAMLHYAPNGNIYSFNADRFSNDPASREAQYRFFAGMSPFVTASGVGRVLHGYKDTLTSLGVSRLRLSHAENMPKKSLPVALVPAQNPTGGPSILTAVDTSSNVYFLITCEYANVYPKVFLAKSYAAGITTLTDPALQGTVTGAAVIGCYAVPYTNSAGTL